MVLNLQKYFLQILTSIWRRKNLVLAIILLSTIILVASQYNSLSFNKKLIEDYDEKKLASLQQSSYDRIVLDKFDNKKIDINDKSVYGQAINSENVFKYQEEKIKDFKPKIDNDVNNNIYIPDLRIVHFDLKGAPPKIEYLKKILYLVKDAGANGILLEYEDMFPFDEPIKDISATNHYSKDEIIEIIALCKKLEFELIPLVQTFGHLEFALKLGKYRKFREIDKYPTAVCPSKDKPFDDLIKPIIDQVIKLHKESGHDLKYIHIGCDEVFHIGHCDLCRSKDHETLYLNHVKKVAEYVKTNHQVIPIIWDDMLRNIYSEKMKEYGLGDLVEPMVWTYIKDIYRFIPYSTFQQFSEVFPSVWGASAFKGAFGETLTVPNVGMHLENNIAWVEALKEQSKVFKNVRGLVITGWQRYDHLAVLCELLPAGIPSLITNLLTVSAGEFDFKSIMKKFDKLMNCSNFNTRFSSRSFGSEEQNLYLGKDIYLYSKASPCQWSGVTVFRLTQQLTDLIKKVNDYIYDVNVHKAWMTDFSFRHNYSNPYRIDEGLNDYSSLRYQLISTMQNANECLKEFFDENTTLEWIEQNILPYMLKLENIYKESKRIYEVREWKPRPLEPSEKLKEYLQSPNYF